MFKLPLLALGVLSVLAVRPVLAQNATAPNQPQTFPLMQEKAGVVVRLTQARWGAENEFNPAMPVKDAAQRVLYVWYEVERPGAADKDSVTMRWRELSRYSYGAALNQSFLQGPLYRSYLPLRDVDPRNKNLQIELEVPRPNAPPGATGISEEILDFGAVPVPAPGAAPIEIHAQRVTELGTTVEIESVYLQPFQRLNETTDENGKKKIVPSDHQRVALVARVTPPKTPVVKATVRLGWGLVTDEDGKNLNSNTYYYGYSARGQGDAERIHLDATDDVTRSQLHLKVKVEENAPSRRVEAWSPKFRFTLDASALPVEVSPLEPSPPLAKSSFEGGRVELESMSAHTYNSPNKWLRLWTASPRRQAQDNKTQNDVPPWIWSAEIQEVRDNTGQIWNEGFSRRAVYFHADGSAIQEGESGGDVLFNAPKAKADATEATSLDITVSLSARRVFDAHFTAIPIPRDPGQILPLQQVVRNAAGAELILHKIGAFDVEHPTALTRPDSLRPSEAGLALVVEYHPVPDDAKLDGINLLMPEVRDNNASLLPVGVTFGTNGNKYPMTGGDLLKAGNEAGTWFTILLPPPPDATKTLNLSTTIAERKALEAPVIVEWKAVPLRQAAE